MDLQVCDRHFDAFTNVTFQDGMPMNEKFNMCFLAANPMFLHDLTIQDLSGDLKPNGNVLLDGFSVNPPK
eukprot:6542780-Ditylum_brightwellii.AAC.1